MISVVIFFDAIPQPLFSFSGAWACSLREGSPWAHTSGQGRISERNDPAGRSQARQRQAALPLERVVSKREPARRLVIKGFSFSP